VRASAARVWAAIALLFPCVLHAGARADEVPEAVVVRAHTEPAATTIGTRFRYVLEVTTASDVEVVLSQPTERIGEFQIVDFGDEAPRVEDGKTVTTRWFTLMGYTPGEFMTKSPPVFYRSPGEALREANGHEVRISVESLLAKNSDVTDIRDIKALEAVPIDWRPYYLVGGMAMLGLAIAGGTWLAVRRRRRVVTLARPSPPHQVAYAALDRLRRAGLVESGGFKEFYSGLSDIVRTYLEQRFRVRAPEMTTEEFLLASARDGRLLGPHRALLGEFLRESDLVKFARHVPTIADAERAFAAARRFVDDTVVSTTEERACA